MSILSTPAILRYWGGLSALIILFMGGYLYMGIQLPRGAGLHELTVPVIFATGALFCAIVTRLACYTARDLKRISVLEHENVTDPLMGIYNRRFLDEALHREFARSRRYALPLSLLIIDVDHFKRVNDTYGHQVGDDVLKALGALLKSEVRESDVVARYGGEEIAIIAPSTPLENVHALAERIRARVEATPLVPEDTARGTPQVSITVSIGAAAYRNGLTRADEIFAVADGCLYEAKEGGRNRVVICELPGSGGGGAASPVPVVT